MRYEVTVLSDKELSGRKIMAITDNRQDAEEIADNLRIAGYKGVMIPQIQHIEGGYVMSNVTNEEMQVFGGVFQSMRNLNESLLNSTLF